MKKLLYTLLAVSIIFSACEEEDIAPANTNNNGNNSSGTIADVVGVWQLQGFYDASDNLDPFDPSSPYGPCVTQSNWELEADGDAILEWFYLEDEVSGPCISSVQAVTFSYINSTTLQFIIPNSSCGTYTATIINSTQLKWPACDGDNGTFDGSYILFEKQP